MADLPRSFWATRGSDSRPSAGTQFQNSDTDLHRPRAVVAYATSTPSEAMIQPGLERISQLLKNVRFPWKSIHVAGTNGKGSICHYASSLLISKRVKCGKFTSPHLVDREKINASSFEILTATAFHIFNEERVDVGVIEVGMGGKLDATNILNNQAVCVISKIAQDHQNFLGTTLGEIAQHKAGILKPKVPYIVNPLNEWHVHDTIDQYAKEIGAGPRLAGDTPELGETLCSDQNWDRFAQALRPFQRDNAILAIVAVKETCRELGLEFAYPDIAEALVKIARKDNPGRLQYLKVQPVFGQPGIPGRDILVDGAHNPDAAQALKDFIFINERRKRYHGQPPKSGWPVTWVLAMTEGKDALQYLEPLLQPGDNVITTSFGPVDGMPWVKPMDPKQLLDMAKTVQPGITGLYTNTKGALRALCAAKHITEGHCPIVVTGSLYLVGDLHREIRGRGDQAWWKDPEHEEDRSYFTTMLEEERAKVNTVLSLKEPDAPDSVTPSRESEEMKRRRLENERRSELLDEIADLDGQMQRLDEEEKRLSRVRHYGLLKAPVRSSRSRSLPEAIPQSSNMSNTQINKSLSNLPEPPEGKYYAAFDSLRQSLQALHIKTPYVDPSNVSVSDSGKREQDAFDLREEEARPSEDGHEKGRREDSRGGRAREDRAGDRTSPEFRKHLSNADKTRPLRRVKSM
ncbi:folylpolyglutamate synthase [Neocucurbitaria cava]|uniref:Folylpolyglutamate synthase n=1 Tax=Neocucurbitaria cava TaxID=798079 RepID=A0A9W8Y379_9PLEO|nr:folylpolyglutamate synthase [Neocucurbitaria cava]